jgi:O-antigen/teichoic acid export membrane protein
MASVKERIIKNSFWSFSSAMINRFGGLVFTIILTRFLLPEGFGIYSLVLSTAMIFYTFTELGTNKAITRYISHSLEKDKEKIPAYYNYLFKIKFCLSSAAAISLFLLSYPIAFYFYKNPLLFLPLIVSSFYIFVMAIETFYLSMFYSVEKAEFATISYSLEEVLKICFVVLIFCFIASSHYIVAIFSSYVLILSFLLFFNVHYLKKLLPEIYLKPKVEIDKKRVRRFVGILTIATISGVFFSYIDSVMIGFFISPEFVGYYRAAYSLVFGIAGILSFPSVVLLPYFTKLNKESVSRVFNESFRLLSVFSIPSLFGLIILGRYFIVLFFGDPFLPAYLPLSFLAILIFPVVSISLFLSLFSAKEKPEIFAKLIVMASLMNIVLNLLLIKCLLPISPEWATAGAAIATTFSWLFYLFAFVYSSRKKLDLEISLKPIVKPILASIVMSFFMIFSMKIIGDMNIFWGIFEISLGMFVYLIMILLIKGITIKDISLFKILLSRKKSS